MRQSDLLALLCLLFPVSSFAYPPWHWRHCTYPMSTSTLVAQMIDRIAGDCVFVPLQLERTPSGSLTVDSWGGGYDRDVVMTSTYRIDSYDPCTGAFLGSMNDYETGPQRLDFNVVNPNLDASLPSYVQNAPMTDEEAQAALPEALGRCQSLRVGPWPQ